MRVNITSHYACINHTIRVSITICVKITSHHACAHYWGGGIITMDPHLLCSFYNRVFRPSCTLDTIPQACWITSRNASTRLGPPFFNSSAAIESAPAALLFFQRQF
jgi:hypothetical protein